MAVLTHLRPQAILLAAIAMASLISAGCGESEQIRSYSARKETKPIAQEAPPAATPGEPTDRMLTAILPSGDQAYFFKVVGPVAAVDKREKELNDFFTGIRLGDDGKPKWQLPADWQERPGNAMRLATIIIPADGKPLEVAVTALPWAGTPDGLLQNVNRWRGQMQLPPTSADKVADDIHQVKAGDLTIAIVDLRGRFAGSGMSPPFATGGPTTALPPGHPPIGPADAPPAGNPPANAGVTSPVAKSEESGEPTDRMLAAIVPDGDRAWFFKIVGPLDAVNTRSRRDQPLFREHSCRRWRSPDMEIGDRLERRAGHRNASRDHQNPRGQPAARNVGHRLTVARHPFRSVEQHQSLARPNEAP